MDAAAVASPVVESGGTMRPVLRSSIARGATLLPSAAATLLASRLILHRYGISVFNSYALVFSVMVLIPLNDLGAGAAVTTAVAEGGVDDPNTRRVVLTAARTLALSGAVLAAASLALSGLGLWGRVVGGGTFATGAFGLALTAFALSFVPGLGQSVLLGAHKSHVTILVQACLAPGMCVGIVLATLFHAGPLVVVIVPGLTVLAVAVVNAWVSARITGFRLLPLMAELPLRKRHPGARIRGIAGPALIVSIAGPLALQMDRLVLSHFGTSNDVANYSVAIQVFAPLVALILAAGQPLWPMYTNARTAGTRPPSMTKILLLFVTLATLGAGGLCFVAAPLAQMIGGNRIHLSAGLLSAAGLMVVVYSLAVPLSMALMYPGGLRLAAVLALVCLPINLVLSIVLAGRLGAPGPLFVGDGVQLIGQVIPAMLFLRHQGRIRRPAAFLPEVPPAIPVAA
jgi:O-antigen/teichoic acid export membrane protein